MQPCPSSQCSCYRFWSQQLSSSLPKLSLMSNKLTNSLSSVRCARLRLMLLLMPRTPVAPQLTIVFNMGKFLIVSSTIYLAREPTSLYTALLVLYVILLGYLLGFSYIYKGGRAASHPVLLVWKAAALVLAAWAALVALTLTNAELDETAATSYLFGGAGSILLASFSLTIYLLSTSAGGRDNRRDRVELRKALLAFESALFPHALKSPWASKRRFWRRSVTNSQLPEHFRRLYASIYQSWAGSKGSVQYGKDSDIQSASDFWQIHRLVQEDVQLLGYSNIDKLTTPGEVDARAVLLPAQLKPGDNVLVHLIGEVAVRGHACTAIIVTLLDSNLQLLLLYGQGDATDTCQGALLLDAVKSVSLSVTQVRGAATVSMVLRLMDRRAATGRLCGARIVVTPSAAPHQDATLATTVPSLLQPISPCPLPAALKDSDPASLIWTCMWKQVLDQMREAQLHLAQKQIDGMSPRA